MYKGVRPPELVIKVIQRAKDKNVVYDFYGTGQHLISAVLEKEDQTEKTVKLHGTVSSTEARKIQDAAHFLINIDNTTTLQVPSKIFEYMCTGKPIINFYFIENSPTLHYLEKYPNCVNIFLNGNMDTEAKRLDHFITMNKDIMVPYSEIKEAFKKNTPEYVADLFYTEYSEAKRRRS